MAADAAAAAMAAAVAIGFTSEPSVVSRASIMSGVLLETSVGCTSFFEGFFWSCLLVRKIK